MPGGDMESMHAVAELRALADAVIRGNLCGEMYGLFLQSFRRERQRPSRKRDGLKIPVFEPVLTRLRARSG